MTVQMSVEERDNFYLYLSCKYVLSGVSSTQKRSDQRPSHPSPWLVSPRRFIVTATLTRNFNDLNKHKQIYSVFARNLIYQDTATSTTVFL